MNKITHEVKNSGFIHEEPPVEDYKAVLGGISKSPLKEPPTIFKDGIGWKEVWAEYDVAELQFNRKFDTYSCVVYGIAKATCLYLYEVYDINITISEMYNAFFADVVQNKGTTVSKGFKSFRKHGWISDKKYSFNYETTAKEFFRKPPKEICIKAEGSLLKFDFHYEVLENNLETIFEAYKKTPVVLSGFAWIGSDLGVYFDNGNTPNHVFLGLEPLINGNNLISDTYTKNFKYKNESELRSEDLLKELDKSFKYGSAHRCWVTLKKEKKSLLNKTIDMLKKIGRDIRGGLYFIKDGKKQKIENGFQGFAALVEELGIDPKNNNVSDEKLAKLKDYKFFG